MENSLQQSFDGEKCAVGLSVLQNSEEKKKKDKEKEEEGKRETTAFFRSSSPTHSIATAQKGLFSSPLLCNQIVPKLPLG